MSQNNGGDVLARGNVRCIFAPMGGNVTQSKWDSMWEADDEKHSGNADVKSSGNAGVSSRKTRKNKTE